MTVFGDELQSGLPRLPDADPSETGIPDDIEEFRARVGVKNTFSSTLRRRFEDGREDEILATFQNTRPSFATMGTQFGPGRYTIAFAWKDGSGANKVTKREDFQFSLGREYTVAHEEYLADQEDEAEKRRRARVLRRQEHTHLNGAPLSPAASSTPVDGVQSLLQAKQQLEQLGVSFGGSGGGAGKFAGLDIMALLSLPILPKILEFFTSARSASTAREQGLLEKLLLAQNTKQPGADVFDTLFKTANSVLTNVTKIAEQAQSAIGPKKDVLDRLVDMAEKLMPMLAAGAAPQIPTFAKDAALANPDVQAVIKNPELKENLFKKLEEIYGSDQVAVLGGVLKDFGIER